MTATSLTFWTNVDDWCREFEERLLAIFRGSAQRVVSIASNGVPIDLGFARASVRASLESMPPIDPNFDNKAKRVADWGSALGEVVLVIAGAQLGQTIYVGWTCSYILPLEFGHSKQAPTGFVRLAAEQWPTIVAEVVGEAKARAAQ